ncbi:fungistatic metabolite [Fusarium sp. NRRL 52700]|nr:fungistatic metabolite [Fusarium sp. NRRL 52700]
MKDFASLNPWIGDDCCSLSDATMTFGKIVCTTPSDGHYNRTVNRSDPAVSYYADEVVPRPENASSTANVECGRWHTVQEGHDCLSVLGQHDISLSLFTAANPSISPRNCITSLIPGQAYCVSPTKKSVPESYSPPAYWRSGCYFSRNQFQDIHRPTLALTGQKLSNIKPLSISSCQVYCLSHSLPVFDLQNRDTCLCDDRLRIDSRREKNWGCESRCGYGKEDCGPEQQPIEVFSSYQSLAVEYANIGCFETKEEDVIAGKDSMQWENSTLEECANFCTVVLEADYFALQTEYYSPVEQEEFCICGNQLNPGIKKLSKEHESTDEKGNACRARGGTNIYTTNSKYIQSS